MRTYGQWSKEGICLEEPNLSLFRNKPKRTRDLKAVCNVCPVASECFSYAMIYGESGFWGGTTESERQIIIERSPLLRARLREEAQRLSILEIRYSMEEYWKSLREARRLGQVAKPRLYSAPVPVQEELAELLGELNTLLESDFEPNVPPSNEVDSK